MQKSTEYRNALHRFAQFLASATFLLIIAGGLVTSTGSGLAVPDWPLSYGQVMPPMVGGIFYEHGHRMVATFVGFLTTILAFWVWRVEERRWMRVVAWVALGAVIAQGLLGGLTVYYLLPTPVSVLHATLAQTFFSLTVFIAMATSKSWKTASQPERPGIGKTQRLAMLLVGSVFVQLILGALMRHTNSALAIPDFPLSYGKLLPPSDGSAVSSLNEYRLTWWDLGPITMAQIWIHFVHRAWAVVVAVLGFVLARDIFVNHPSESRLREPALLIVLLLVMQIFLGGLTVWSGRSVETATAHVATGALLLAASVFLAVRAKRYYATDVIEPIVEMVPGLSRS
ncbi:MAG TPA: COX15/CtaA family protein [Bacteroidota bacterium]